MADDFSEFDTSVVRTNGLSLADRDDLLRLFEQTYDDADPDFLDRSLTRLRFISLARCADRLVGFVLGDTRILDLPRMSDEIVHLAGLACVDDRFRRRGLWGLLGQLTTNASMQSLPFPTHVIEAKGRALTCGRVAHPAAFRSMARLPTVVPRPGVSPTPWQQEVGATIAEAYGVKQFDAETFVCIGAGTPIGYPKIVMDVDPGEWEVFAHVDRDRGDALLAIAWVPDGPEGW